MVLPFWVTGAATTAAVAIVKTTMCLNVYMAIGRITCCCLRIKGVCWLLTRSAVSSMYSSRYHSSTCCDGHSV
jgi:hypothetical protein